MTDFVDLMSHASPALLLCNVVLLGILLLHVAAVVRLPSFGQRSEGGKRSSTDGSSASFPGIDPTQYATLDEQQQIIERLAILPQFRLLADGSLVDWSTGYLLKPCECSQSKAVPHLQWVRLTKDGLGMITLEGLRHFLNYQECVARGRMVESVA